MAGSVRRERLRAQMSADVRTAAGNIIATRGVEELTLAAVARSVGVTPAALYHHFPRGLPDIVFQVAEDIVTALVAQLQAAVALHSEDDFGMRMIEPSRTFRRWAITHSREFNLLFGAPSPAAGDAHGELTSAWIRRLAAVWGPIFVQLWHAHPYPVLADHEMDPRLLRQMQDYSADTGVDIPAGALVVMLGCWRSIYGQVALEVFHHFAPLMKTQEPMFEMLMQDLMRSMHLEHQYRPPG